MELLNATFTCQINATAVWLINHTHLQDIPRSRHDISLFTKVISNNGRSLDELTINADIQYNESIITCQALLPNNTYVNATAYLHLQGLFPYVSKCCSLNTYVPHAGRLSAVSNIVVHNSSTTISVTWTAPFSLNLTDAEPDIVYCVEVFNITNEERHILTDCSVLQTQFSFYYYNNSNPRDQFKFIITPRSNIEGARNGTSSKPVFGQFNDLIPTTIEITTTVETSTTVSGGTVASRVIPAYYYLYLYIPTFLC